MGRCKLPAFGFKTITVGAWVTKEERLIAANLIYDSLADLTQILNIKTSNWIVLDIFGVHLI